jgi:flagellar hook-length control protein FliK
VPGEGVVQADATTPATGPASVSAPATPVTDIAPASIQQAPPVPDGAVSATATAVALPVAASSTTAPAPAAADPKAASVADSSVATAKQSAVDTRGAVATAPVLPASTTAGSTIAGGTTSNPDTKDGQPGSEPATQAPAQATQAVPAPADAPAPVTASTSAGATQAPAIVVPSATPTTTNQVASVPLQGLTTDRERFVRLVDGLEARLRVSGADGGKAMRMTLRPPELGELVVRLHVAPGGQSATATLLAQHHETGDLLAQAAGDLRQALADRGLRLDRLEVTAGPLTGDALPDRAPSGAPNPKEQQDARRTHYAFDARDDLGPDVPPTETPDAATHEGLYVLA